MRKVCDFIFLSLLFLCVASSVTYGLERFDIVTTDQMKQMIEERAAGKIDFILVNSLDEIIFRNSSIPGSINIPWIKVDKLAHMLGEDKNKLIVTY